MPGEDYVLMVVLIENSEEDVVGLYSSGQGKGSYHHTLAWAADRRS